MQEMWISLSRSLEVKGREAGDSLTLTTDKLESKGKESTKQELGDKSELGFNKKGRRCFRLP